jgi:hypothetical protein
MCNTRILRRKIKGNNIMGLVKYSIIYSPTKFSPGLGEIDGKMISMWNSGYTKQCGKLINFIDPNIESFKKIMLSEGFS